MRFSSSPLVTSQVSPQKPRLKSLPLHVLPSRIPGLHRCVAVVCGGRIIAVSKRRNPLLAQLRIGIVVILYRYSLATNSFLMIHRSGPRDIPPVLKWWGSALIMTRNGTGLLWYLVFAEVLARVAGLIAHAVQQFVESHCEEGAEKWPNEVDPEVAWEMAVHDCWAEGAGKIERTSSEVDACYYTLDRCHPDTVGAAQTAEFGQEESETDSNRS
jgi:hypothetical protein